MTSPHKPRLNEEDLATLKSSFEIVLSEHHAARSSSFSKKIYLDNMEQQHQNQTLKNAPGTFNFLKAALDQNLDDIPRYLWNNGYDKCSNEELSNNDMIRHVLTDFRLNCLVTRNNNSSTNERTPFSEHFIPIFKAFAGITGLMNFTW
jgi:hypothetical protein